MSSGIYRYSQYIVIQLFSCTPYFIQKSFSRFILLHLPSSFPFPGSTPECIVWYVLVLLRTYYPWGHGPEKRDLYDPIKPCTRPVQTFRHFPAKKKRRGPPIHSRVQLHSFEDLYGVGFRIYGVVYSIRSQQVYRHSLMQNDVASLGSSKPHNSPCSGFDFICPTLSTRVSKSNATRVCF